MPHLTKLKVNTSRNCQRYARNTKRKEPEKSVRERKHSTKNKEKKSRERGRENVLKKTQEFSRACVYVCERFNQHSEIFQPQKVCNEKYYENGVNTDRRQKVKATKNLRAGSRVMMINLMMARLMI